MGERNGRMGNVKWVGLNDGDAVVVGLDLHRKTASATTRVNGTEAARRVTPVDTAAVMGSLRAARPYVKKGDSVCQ